MFRKDLEKLKLRPEHVSLHALNSFIDCDSSSRSVMFANHIKQSLIIKGGEEKILQTGVDTILGKYLGEAIIEKDCVVLDIIPRYRTGYDIDSFKINPETIIIYEELETEQIGYISVPNFMSYHNYYGYDLVKTKDFEDLKVDSYLEKDTILARSIAKQEDGGYSFGLNLNTVYMTYPEVAEDGMIVSESAIEKMKYDIYVKRTVFINKNEFPLNLYGDENNFKPFPEIGEYVKEEGILLVLRDYNENMLPCLLSKYSLMDYDINFDNVIYVKQGKGQVIDIKVDMNNRKKDNLFKEMRYYLDKYYKANYDFHLNIIKAKDKIIKQRNKEGRKKINFTRDFHKLIVDSLVYINPNINKTFKSSPILEFKVDFTIKYEVTPFIGSKITNMHGGKGVIVKILPDNEMPVDKHGNRAELIVDPSSIISRMNVGALYENYVTASAMEVKSQTFEIMNKTNDINKAFNNILNYLKIISPEQFEIYSQIKNDDDKLEIINEVMEKHLFIYYPVDGNKNHIEIIKNIENSIYKPFRDNVTYIVNGKKHTYEDKIFIGKNYIMLLEKTAENWSSVSSSKTNHFRLPTTLSKENRNKMPWRQNAVRFIGETEVRIFSGYTDPLFTAEVLDRNNNIKAHKNVYENILNSDKPTNIDFIVNRNKVKYGESGPKELIKSITNSVGFKMVYTKGQE